MNPLRTLIHSNIFIALAAVSLTVETQIQLGMKPHWNTYFLFIFFAVLFEYNLHQLLSVQTKQEATKKGFERRMPGIRKKIYFKVFISGVGFFCSAFFVNEKVLFIFVPIALLTILYSILIFCPEKHVSGLRKIPFLKNILIAVVWSAATVVLPVFQSIDKFYFNDIFLIFFERYFFIFALSIPFDIRDMEVDKQSGLKTVPILLNTQTVLNISYLSLGTFFMITLFHYQIPKEWFLVAALGISALSTYLFIRLKTFRNLSWYYEGILDGTMFFQGLFVLAFYYFTCN